MTVEADTSTELEITREGPQSYLERAVASMEKLGEQGGEEDPIPKAEPGNDQEPVKGEVDDEKLEAKPEPTMRPPADAAEADPLADLERKIAERQAKRSQQSQPSEVDTLKQQIAAMEAKLNERRSDEEAQRIVDLARKGKWAELAQAAGHDPLRAYDEFTKDAADHGATAAERRIAALEARLEQAEREKAERAKADEERTAKQQAEEIQRRAVRGWLDYSDTVAEKLPHLAALDPGDRAREGVWFAQQLTEAGEKVTYERVATLVEAKYKRLAARLGAKGTNGASKSADAGGPTTITNDLAAQSSGPDDRPKRREEYLSNAVKTIKRIQQGA